MPINRVLAVVTVADFDAGLAWYRRLFGRPADDRPMDGLAEWHFPGSAAVQIVHDPSRAGSALLTLGVDSVEAFRGGITARGLAVEEITTATFTRLTAITDPDGNRITFAEPRETGNGAD
ncbi:VOC family protein [Amycolatopsis sp. NPDC059021]|uniref:VOC family protein n=1 Tax=Amycolatopsis sp. NPDC059021 TaxID=3346704 RepID=UPI00366DA817